MKKIVIIGANDFQNQLILKAKEMGFETHVFAWQDGSIGERTADHFYPVSIVEIDEILEIDVERRAINAAVDNMKAEQNRVSKLIPQYKKEGKVFGIGCKIFTIAGPVILYGIFFSWCAGLIYLALKLIHVL